MEKTIVLLRGINVGGKRKLAMAELRKAAISAGIADFQTYIQSGNLLFSAASAADAETKIEALAKADFDMAIEAIARTARQWSAYASGSPFPDAEKDRPNLLHLGISKQRPADDIAEKLRERAKHGEQIIVIGDAIWIDFVNGVADSKLSPAALDKAAGSTVTMRNWRTVCKLAEMLAEG
ncbi:Uncharacterized conserved protein, DUF1697 family [Sphingomonas sp. YR710]|uniref:DUF1697 domain-containing protein n=1 Tax=Sphingomonas sp. YR710 TaxID=1882773 RepID=UPI000888279A|nr:DUF1697 domain-containing protein [Sphingomonas sp. YR710]SDC23060.1 Uncharacterized conserved protein, DUF1697 family [Sphingomonas sp. YR710]